MKRSLFTLLAAATVVAAGAERSSGAIAIGLAGTSLVTFETNAPAVILGSATISGLTAGDVIVDLDYRPSDGLLYGMAGSGRLYTLNPATGSSVVNTAGGAGLLGTAAEIDFNPAANRLRVFSAGDANARITPGTGDTTIDPVLAFAGDDVNAGANPNLVGAAYTNNIIAPASTVLYSIDSNLDILIRHEVAPGFSQLRTVADLSIGGLLGLDASLNVGFDIQTLNGVDTAYFSNGNALYTLDLATGEALPLGSVGLAAGGPALSTFAIVPEPGTALLTALPLGLLALRRRR